MHTKRIIPCLDVNNGRVVKGVNFVSLRDAGDPVEIAKAYDKAGADELVFLDITASSDARGTVVDMVRKVAENVFIPFTVGGGIRTVDDFKALLREGADKISINSSAINTPNLISEAAEKFGSQCVVVAIDAKKREDGSGWNIYKNGGRIDVGIDAVEWAAKVEKLGAGEILLTSMDCDGTKAGYRIRWSRQSGPCLRCTDRGKSRCSVGGIFIPLQRTGNQRSKRIFKRKRCICPSVVCSLYDSEDKKIKRIV